MEKLNLSEQWKRRLDRINQLYGKGANNKNGSGYNVRKYMILKNKKIVAVNIPYPDALMLLKYCRRMAEKKAKDDEFDMAVMEF